MSVPNDVLEAIAYGEWEYVLVVVKAKPYLVNHVDIHGLSLLHYMCMAPNLPTHVMETFLTIFPSAILTLHRSKNLLVVAKCSKEVLDLLANAGFPKAVQVKQRPPRWQEREVCAMCQSSFSVFKRRHYCRHCGSSVCGKHSKHMLSMDVFGVPHEGRACDGCWDNQSTHE